MKLFVLRYSPYARKVQLLLDLLGRKYERIEVRYGDRSELARLTGGYVYVPVLVDDAGQVLVESRRICQRLLDGAGAAALVPQPWQGPIWAYADFCDGPLEDVLFRLASPSIHAAWQDPWERGLYQLVKERKFGAGCLDDWRRQKSELLVRGAELLAPTLQTLSEQPYLFGSAPTLADAALYGNLAMLNEADPGLVVELSPRLADYARRLEERAGTRS